MLLSAPSRRRTRLGAIPLLFLTIVGLLVGGLSAPATAAVGDTITLSGTVTRSVNGSPTAEGGVKVEAFLTNNLTTPVTSATSAADGSWAFPASPALTEQASGSGYKIKFSGVGYDTVWFASGGVVADAASATVVNASSNAINATVTYAPVSVSGTVRNAQGQGIQGITIALQTRTVGQNGATTYSPVTTAPATVTTGSSGAYSFTVRPGSYVLSFAGSGYGTSYYAGDVDDEATLVQDREAATLFTVQKASPEVLDATLTATPLITGTVKDANGTAIQGVTVTAETRTLQQDGTFDYGTAPVATDSTGADGSFALDVPAGSYVVGYDTDGYVDVFWNGAGQSPTTNKDTAQLVTVSAGNAKDASATLSLRASTVSGRALAPNGSGLEGVTVRALRYQAPAAPNQAARGTWVTVTGTSPVTTDANGRYKLVVPSATKFRIGFDSPDNAREDRFYPAANVADEAGNVTVAEGQSLTGYDVTLPQLATLSGAVTESTGSALTTSGTVQPLRRIDYTEQGEQGGTAHSSWVPFGQPVSLEPSTSAFLLRLPADTYRLKVVLAGGEEGFLPGLVGLDEAPGITLGDQASLTGQTYRLPPKRIVSGTVKDRGSTGQVGATVSARYRYVTDIRDGLVQLSDWIEPTGTNRRATSEANGVYALALREREYQVYATPSGSTVRSYFGSPSGLEANAAPVVVAGADVTGVDIVFGTIGVQNLVRPWVTGLADPGSTLTANPGTWSPVDVTFTYVWQYLNGTTWTTITRNNQPTGIGNPSADGKTLVIPTETAGLCTILLNCTQDVRYRVLVTGSRQGSASVDVDSLPTASVKSTTPPAQELRAVPVVQGTPATGQSLTTTDGVWATQSTYTYQWYADGAPIAGATANGFQLTAAQLGRKISSRVTPTSGGVPGASDETSAVAKGQLTNTTKPRITGTAQVGSVLTAEPGAWNAPSPAFAYQWFANGQEIGGATGKTYTPTLADTGKTLVVRVVAAAPGYSNGQAVSEATAPLKDDPTKVTNKTVPVVSGTAKVGEVLTTTDGTWTNSPTGFTYQWAADGTPIAGATAKTLTLAAAQAGKKITVTVTATKTGLTSGTATSAPTAAVAPADPTTCTIVVTGGPTVTGTAAVGQLLTAQPGTATPDGVTPSYQWLRDAQAIAGATASTYRVVAADQGSALAVQVTYRKTDCADVVRTAQAGTVPEQPQEPVKPSLSTVKKIKGTKLVLKVDVTATTQDPVMGDVELSENGRTLATKTLVDGKRKFVVRGFERGFHSVQITFQGNSLVKERTKTITFNIR